MNALDHLAACAGEWRGTNRLHDPRTGRPEDSPSTARVTPVLHGWFVRFDYTWGYQGTPQEGSLLIGMDPKAGSATAQWIDTWHMGRLVMSCTGAVQGNTHFSFRGSYAVPPGRDCGWRVELDLSAPGMLRVAMVNVSPDGVETPAAEASYSQP